MHQIELGILQFNLYTEKFRHLRDQSSRLLYGLDLKIQPPLLNENAVILYTNFTPVFSPRSVYELWNDPTSKEGEFVNVLSSHYESLQYPLLFPIGSQGWSIDCYCKLTQRKY
jgi:hypothetical protein